MPDRKFQKLLDLRNQALWEEINSHYRVLLLENPEPGYLTYFDQGECIVEIDMNDLDPAAFTHELLHVYLRIRKINLALCLKQKMPEELKKIFSTSLRVHIGNCLEHVKILPLFLEMGYSHEEFLIDFHQRIIGQEQLKAIRKIYLINGKRNWAAVDFFIDKFFSMKASNNEAYSYSFAFQELKNVDPDLYRILDSFWMGWQNYEIGRPPSDYHALVDRFLFQLIQWKNKPN